MPSSSSPSGSSAASPCVRGRVPTAAPPSGRRFDLQRTQTCAFFPPSFLLIDFRLLVLTDNAIHFQQMMTSFAMTHNHDAKLFEMKQFTFENVRFIFLFL